MNIRAHSAEDEVEILVVEDSRTQAERLKYLLEQAHYRVRVAENGNQALALLGEHLPTLVITDIIMPEMNGYELCKRIKSEGGTREIPVILLTSLASSEDVLEGLACGADNFITKPYSEEYLLSSIEKILAGRKLRKSERVRIGVEIMFAGKSRFVTADQQQMLGLLISTYEAAVQRNTELAQARDELRSLNERLEDLVEQRTAELSKEIAERKRAQEALQKSERQYRELVENLNDIIYSLDTEGRITYVSPVVEKALGYSPAELKGEIYLRMIHPEDLPQVQAAFKDVSQGRLYPTEYRIRAKSGGYHWISTSSRPLSQEGRVVGLSGVLTDITERKKAEEERERLQVQLQQAQKLEAVGRLTGGIAHDFNNLLTPIIGNAEMALSDMSKEDPLYEAMEEIRNAGARAASLTRQLLAFSRKQILQTEIMDLNGVVRDMDKMLRRIIGEDMELETSLSPDLGLVQADAGQVEQILMNLVVNARDAMPKGGKVTIETRNVDLDDAYARNHIAVISGPYVMLAVSDTGVGMSKEVQDQLFEPFFTTKGQGKGTGLGLSTVYGIVKQSKGNIWVYSEPGQGSTFKVYLPRVEEMAPAAEKPKQKESVVGSGTVLVVEDDEMVRNMTVKVLERYGYTVLCARGGEEAERICREKGEGIRLMVTDVVMPGMSGKELAESLGRMQPGMKVLFMSGYTDNAIVHHGVLDKGVAFIQKPFTPEGLARKVREVLGARNGELGTRKEEEKK